ncbi:hypothetical protein SAMN04488028_101662 [Reichenbachiella agariperforans]|uniref:Uncharacterized protein n=1 Tax=Reichenbachiella agariperforans TaxID=156994 RepID=A0A1M6KQ20_REIAG|nr:hypothetical protein SAMN04488028_101662 [Reichenbachiella agariperforans]
MLQNEAQKRGRLMLNLPLLFLSILSYILIDDVFEELLLTTS